MKEKIGVIVLIIILYGFLFKNIEKTTRVSQPPVSAKTFVLQSAKVLEVNQNGIVINGYGKLLESSEPKKLYITLKIDSKTIVKNMQIPIPEEKARSGRRFEVKPEILEGNIKDLVPGTKIATIQTIEDIFEIPQVKALEIIYLTYKFIPKR